MQLITGPASDYLGVDDIVDWYDEAVQRLAAELRSAASDETTYAELAFEHVRDRISHSWDAQDRRVTLSASDVLREGVGLCYGKSHLLVALLRAEGIPAGLCYQRLAEDDGRFTLHGLVAVFLQGRWTRLDPRGNKPGVDAQFSLEVERLAWPVRAELGEVDYPEVMPAATPAVVEALSGADDMLTLAAGGLPEHLK